MALEKRKNLKINLHEKVISLEKYMKSFGYECMPSGSVIIQAVEDLKYDPTISANVNSVNNLIDSFDTTMNDTMPQNNGNKNPTGAFLRKKRLENNFSLNFTDVEADDFWQNLDILRKSLLADNVESERMFISDADLFVNDRLIQTNFELSRKALKINARRF